MKILQEVYYTLVSSSQEDKGHIPVCFEKNYAMMQGGYNVEQKQELVFYISTMQGFSVLGL